MDSELLACNGEDDYVHLLVCAHPKTTIANLVGKLKGKSSYLFRKEFWPVIKKPT
ncbi:MAG: transposase [Candidatus Thiodiazotropha sp.]